MRISNPLVNRFLRASRLLALLAALLLCSESTPAQQPFITDDTDVTPRHRFHFEFSNEYDLLQRASFPSLRQNTADAELDYGLFENFEIGIEAPVLTIRSDQSAPVPGASGLGDLNLSFKYNFVRE